MYDLNSENKDGKQCKKHTYLYYATLYIYFMTSWTHTQVYLYMLHIQFIKRMHSPPFSFHIHANGTAVNPSKVHRSELHSAYQFNWIHLQTLKKKYICIFASVSFVFKWQLRDISQWSMHWIRARASSSLFFFLNSHLNCHMCECGLLAIYSWL